MLLGVILAASFSFLFCLSIFLTFCWPSLSSWASSASLPCSFHVICASTECWPSFEFVCTCTEESPSASSLAVVEWAMPLSFSALGRFLFIGCQKRNIKIRFRNSNTFSWLMLYIYPSSRTHRYIVKHKNHNHICFLEAELLAFQHYIQQCQCCAYFADVSSLVNK